MGRSLKALLDIAFGNCHVMEYLIQTKGSFSIELGHNSILSLITFSGVVDINLKNIKRLSVRNDNVFKATGGICVSVGGNAFCHRR